MPDLPELAETYYSQFEDEFELAEETEDAADRTLCEDDDDDDEIEDLMNCMQNALDKSDTGKRLHLGSYMFVFVLRGEGCWSRTILLIFQPTHFIVYLL